MPSKWLLQLSPHHLLLVPLDFKLRESLQAGRHGEEGACHWSFQGGIKGQIELCSNWEQTPALLNTKISNFPVVKNELSALSQPAASQSSRTCSCCHPTPPTHFGSANEQKVLALVGKQILHGCLVFVSDHGIIFLETLFLALLSKLGVVRTLHPDPRVNLAAISG